MGKYLNSFTQSQSKEVEESARGGRRDCDNVDNNCTVNNNILGWDCGSCDDREGLVAGRF